MKPWMRRVRAALGRALIWGAIWACGGAILARVPGFDSDLPFPLLFAALGFLSGILFSGIRVGIESRSGAERTSLWGLAAGGAASGLLLSGIITLGAALRGAAPWDEFLLFGPPLVLASAACATGSRLVAPKIH